MSEVEVSPHPEPRPSAAARERHGPDEPRDAPQRSAGSAGEGPKGRLRRPRPYEVGSLLPFSAVAVAGDPLLLAVPAGMVALLALGALALGAGAAAEVIVPLVSLPPIDAYQDVGVIDRTTSATPAVWGLRLIALAVRALLIGLLVALAVRRVRGLVPAIAGAARDVRERLSTLAFIHLVSFGLFGSVLILRGTLEQGRADPSVRVGLLLGVLILPTALIAAVADRLPAREAFARSVQWIRYRPLGHLVICLLGFLGIAGVEAIAVAGQPGDPPAFASALLAYAAALVTTLTLVALSRRYLLLYAVDAPYARPPRRRPRSVPPSSLRVPAAAGALASWISGRTSAPAERTRDRRLAAGRRGRRS